MEKVEYLQLGISLWWSPYEVGRSQHHEVAKVVQFE